MSAIANFKVKYERPTKLSDLDNEFSPERLAKILATPDDQLTFSDYRNLLGPYSPAGSYIESMYFLPLAFRYVLADHEHSIDVIAPIIGFCSQNRNEFRENGLLETVRACLSELLDYWTREFIVLHFEGRRGRNAEGWPIPYYHDSVKYSAQVEDATSELTRFKTFTDIAESFVKDLAYHNGNPIKAAWFLEYAQTQWPNQWPLRAAGLHKPIERLVNNEELLLEAALLVEGEMRPHEKSPTYWHDMFVKLDLE